MRPAAFARQFCLGLVFCLLAGSTVRAQDAARPQQPPCTGIVIALNGAGDAIGVTDGFRASVANARVPWRVATFRWSKFDQGSWLMDVCDSKNHRLKGEMLAGEILTYRATHPNHMICVAAHSAGCSVVLAAAELLPPGSIDHIVLLGAAVPSRYDLRPALRCVKCDVEVYYSHKDRVLGALGAVSPDNDPSMTYAGQFGFLQPLKLSAADRALYANKLKQFAWHQGDEWCGNKGGHYGCVEKGYIRYVVLPFLLDAQAAKTPK